MKECRYYTKIEEGKDGGKSLKVRCELCPPSLRHPRWKAWDMWKPMEFQGKIVFHCLWQAMCLGR